MLNRNFDIMNMDYNERNLAINDYNRSIATLEKLIKIYPKSSLNPIYKTSIQKCENRILELSFHNS